MQERKNDEKQPKKFQKHVESPTMLTHKYGSMYLLYMPIHGSHHSGTTVYRKFCTGYCQKNKWQRNLSERINKYGMSQNKRDKLIWMQTKEKLIM